MVMTVMKMTVIEFDIMKTTHYEGNAATAFFNEFKYYYS